MFSARAKARYLSGLCRRLATESATGIDVRKTWAREAGRVSGRARWHLENIRHSIDQGDSLAEAVSTTGSFFPPLFRQLVEVGEESGHLPEVFRQLADHYDHQIQVRRQFLQSILWPGLQLTISIGVIGALILAMGVIEQITGSRADILGWGLVGVPGALVYFGTIGLLVGAGMLVIRAIRRGALWIAPVQHFIVRLPWIGYQVKTLAIARFAWTLHVTLESGMEIRQAAAFSLRSTQNAFFTRHIDDVHRELTLGRELNEALAATGAFRPEFIDAIEVGERSGRLVESLSVISRQYQEQATSAVVAMARIATFVVWLLVAVIIILLIFGVFGFYLRTLNEAVGTTR